MQCPTCEAILPTNADYCYNCGRRLTTATPPMSNAEIPEAGMGATDGWQGNLPEAPSSPTFTPPWETSAAPAPPVSSFPASEGLYRENWPDFSGGPAPAATPASTWDAYPPASPIPGPGGYTYGPSGNYPYTPGSAPDSLPGSWPPGFGVAPPRRRGRVVGISIIVTLMVLLVIFGSVFVGIQIGQSHSSSTQTSTTAATPIASPTTDVNKLYQQVTSRNPTFVDPLTDATLSPWVVIEKPTYGCEIKNDGLHVHIKDTNSFYYCTSGRGQFSNFAFQVDMKILSGNGGGMTFRGDADLGNFYYFHVYPDGTYHIYINQNNKLTAELSEGTISPFASGFGQKNTLTVIALSTQINFYVDQKFLTSIQDSTFTNGYLGVLAEDATAPAEVVYTNAQIWLV